MKNLCQIFWLLYPKLYLKNTGKEPVRYFFKFLVGSQTRQAMRKYCGANAKNQEEKSKPKLINVMHGSLCTVHFCSIQAEPTNMNDNVLYTG